MEKAERVVREYDTSFKIDAVQLVLDKGYSVTKAAEQLGISPKNGIVTLTQTEQNP